MQKWCSCYFLLCGSHVWIISGSSLTWEGPLGVIISFLCRPKSVVSAHSICLTGIQMWESGTSKKTSRTSGLSSACVDFSAKMSNMVTFDMEIWLDFTLHFSPVNLWPTVVIKLDFCCIIWPYKWKWMVASLSRPCSFGIRTLIMHIDRLMQERRN